jgi:hypothetical protein
MRPTSGRPVLRRIGDTARGVHLDSRYMILESVGTTFAGKCLRRRGSHCGHDCAAAVAGEAVNVAVMRAIAMILLINLFYFCNRSESHPGSLPSGDCDFDDLFCCRIRKDLDEG